jgi:hypothetical protein
MDENRGWILIISSVVRRHRVGVRAARSDRLQWERVDRVVQIAGMSIDDCPILDSFTPVINA